MMARADDQTLLIAFLLFKNLFLTLARTNPTDLSALQAIYGSLGSPPQLTGWRSTGGDPCGEEVWRGVSCSGESVVSINLSANSLAYSIPYSLSSLKALQHLNVSHNSLSGPIGNVFTDMQSLAELDLSFNHFTGDLPSCFGSLTNLHALYLEDNEFTGSVILLAKLPLSVLYIENNRFSGYVPKQFEFIPRLRINGNQFQPGFMFPPPHVNGSTQTPSSANKSISHGPIFAPSTFGFPSIRGHSNQQRWSRLGGVVGIICGVFLGTLFASAVVVLRIRTSHKSKLDRSKSSNEPLHVLPVTAPAAPEMNAYQCTWSSPHMTNIRFPSVRHMKPERVSKRKGCSRKSRSLVTAKLFSASDLIEATHGYNEDKILGESPMGHVYKAEFPDGQVDNWHYNQGSCRACCRYQILAVKKINMVPLAVYEEDEFLDVIWNMSRLRHPNIATLFGYCVEQEQHILLYDYARNGSLDDAISSSNDTCKALSWKARVRISLGVAHALEYMHCICSPPIAHGNIRASNILLDNELTPHISDCGLYVLSHLISAKSKAHELPVSSNGYAAPELSTPGVDRIKSDVYSYGVVLLELLTGRRAFDSSRKTEEQLLVKWASSRLHDFCSLQRMVDPAIKGTIRPKALSQFADIILLCIQPVPAFRSSITDVTESLISFVQKMVHYHHRTNSKLGSATASELNMSDRPSKSTVAYFETVSSLSSMSSQQWQQS